MSAFPRKRYLVVVLGYRLQSDGRAHAVLEERVAHACGVWRRSRPGEKPLLVMCGGRTAGARYSSEAEVMRDIAVRKYGVRPRDVLLEPRSLTTEGNAAEVHRLGVNNATYDPIMLVTSPDHMPRAQTLFGQHGIRTRASSCGAEKTPFIGYTKTSGV